ncbi:SSI family serine proteinase inhibitor [Streptosporangium canum]|uniref:SSI family serine proteinase inhibitor n=1 Tax=Streptosporangium canum TaxID=324952 RepID=UPI00339F7E10
MNQTGKRFLTVAVLLGLFAGLTGQAANATRRGGPSPARSTRTGETPLQTAPRRWVTIGVNVGTEYAPATRVALLECSPPGGTHPRPAEACAIVSAIRGDVARLKAPPNLMCPQDYDPLLVWTAGLWDGIVISGTRVFLNRCRFDSIMGILGKF